MSWMVFLALIAPLAMGLAAIMMVADGARLVAVHLAFAVGVMPLILAAMGYFVPVLSRSADPSPLIRRLPLLALLGSLGLLWAWGGGLGSTGGRHAMLFAGLAALVAAGGTLLWMLGRRRRCVGRPHGGLAWYGAACLCLLGGLGAALLMLFKPEWRGALRPFHLHINLLGFMGLTALGTLQVLMPTAVGRLDPQAGSRLVRHLPWSLAGVLGLALGAAWGSPLGALLAMLGLVLWLGPILAMGRAWWALYRRDMLSLHGAPASLAWALGGLIALSLLGAAHGHGLAYGVDEIGGFIVAFLLPLVSGAVGQLLPIWLCPGPRVPWHEQARARLGRWAGLRGLICVLAGVGLSLGQTLGVLLVLPFLAHFILKVLRCVAAKPLGRDMI